MSDPDPSSRAPRLAGSSVPDDERQASGLSRRSFLRGGAAGALAGGLLPQLAGAQPGKASEAPTPAVLGPGPVEIALEVNGKTHRLAVEPRVTLLDALRDRLGVTGPKRVCDRATCGACTVIENGELVYACSRLAVDADGQEIVTVEGLGTPERMHPVQAAFVEHDAQQCGFCTPGFVVAFRALLEHNPDPSPAEVNRALGGNLCRCGTYGGMRRVLRAWSKEGV